MRAPVVALFKLLAACWILCAATAAVAQTLVEGVLIVHSNQRPLPAGVLIDDTLRKAVAAGVGRPVELYSEFLDSERAPITAGLWPAERLDKVANVPLLIGLKANTAVIRAHLSCHGEGGTE